MKRTIILLTFIAVIVVAFAYAVEKIGDNWVLIERERTQQKQIELERERVALEQRLVDEITAQRRMSTALFVMVIGCGVVALAGAAVFIILREREHRCPHVPAMTPSYNTRCIEIPFDAPFRY